MVTTSRGILYPSTSDAITPLANHFSNLATSANTALGTLEGKVSYAVNNAADRDARYPAPTQGLRVYRLDTGLEETYLATYNSSTNPGGGITAGWYTSGTEGARLTKSSAQNTSGLITWNADDIGAGLWNSGAPTRVTIRRRGLYLIKANIRLASMTAGYAILRINKNGSDFVQSEDTSSPNSGGGGTYVRIVDVFSAVPGDYFEINTITSPDAQAILPSGSSMSVAKVG